MSGWCRKCSAQVENTLIACPNCDGDEFSFTNLTNVKIDESFDVLEDNLFDNSFEPDVVVKTDFFGRPTKSMAGKEEERALANKRKENKRAERQFVKERRREDFKKEMKISIEKDKLKNFLKTPVGKATTAKENKNGFFEIELEVGSSDRYVFFLNRDHGKYKNNSSTEILDGIEKVGWKLEHVEYYFMPRGESSRDKFLSSGQRVAVSGKTMGRYLFRNTDT